MQLHQREVSTFRRFSVVLVRKSFSSVLVKYSYVACSCIYDLSAAGYTDFSAAFSFDRLDGLRVIGPLSCRYPHETKTALHLVVLRRPRPQSY